MVAQVKQDTQEFLVIKVSLCIHTMCLKISEVSHALYLFLFRFMCGIAKHILCENVKYYKDYFVVIHKTLYSEIMNADLNQ